jgi:hypothetical protein
MVGSTAKVFAARVIIEDPPQSPFGDQMKPIFLDMLPNDEPDGEQETRNTIELQPKAIVIDDYEIARERLEPIMWECSALRSKGPKYDLPSNSVQSDGNSGCYCSCWDSVLSWNSILIRLFVLISTLD